MITQTHAEIISTIRRISWPAILKGEYDPAKASDYPRIVQDMKAGGVTLPVDPREALDLAFAINAELNWCEWEHPALLAVLWALPEVIEQTKDQDVMFRYIAACPDERPPVAPLALDWLMIPSYYRLELLGRFGCLKPDLYQLA